MHEHHSAIAALPRPMAPADAATALVIGRGEPGCERHLRRSHATVVACAPAMLDRLVLDRVRPATVAFALMGAGFDAMQVLERLAAAGYAGTALVFSPCLPNRGMVLRELQALAPGLSVRIVERQSD